MSILHPLTDQGLKLSVSDAGNIKIRGLTGLPPEKASSLVEYAKRHKPAILAALESVATGGDL